MIRCRHIVSTLTQTRFAPPEEREAGGTLADYAKPGAASAVVDFERIHVSEFDKVSPRDNADVAFVYSHADPFTALGSVGAFLSLGTDFLSPVSQFGGGLLGLPNPLSIPGDPSYGLGQSARQAAMGLIAPSLPNLGLGGGGASATYGSDRPSNSVSNGSVIPIPYGTCMVGGVKFAEWTRANADGGLEYYCLLGYAPAPINRFGNGTLTYTTDQTGLTGALIPDGVFINDTPANELQDVFVSLRMGGSSPAVCPGFEYNRISYPYEITLNRGVVQNHVTRDPVTEIWANVVFPNGLRSVEIKSGDVAYFDVTVAVRVYTLAGSLVTTVSKLISAKSTTPWNFTIEVTGLTFDRYRVEVERTAVAASNENIDPEDNEARRVYRVNLASVVEGNPYAAAYNNVAIMAVTARATAQIQSNPTIRAIIDGVSVYRVQTDDTGFSNNPVDVAIDLLTNPIYGGGRRIADSMIDWDAASDAAAWCDELVPQVTGSATTEKRFTFDGVLDVRRGLWGAAVEILRNARVIPWRNGDNISFIIEETRPQTQVFSSAANVEAPGATVTYTNPANRPNRTTVNFLDPTNGRWEQNRVSARFPGSEESTVEPAEVNRWGCTRPTEAMRAAWFLLNSITQTERSMALVAGLDAIACPPGSIVELVRTSAGPVGSGRVSDYGAGYRTLDREIATATGSVYTYKERKDDGTFFEADFNGTGTTSATVTIASLPGGNPIGRIWAVLKRGKVSEKYMVNSIIRTEDFKRSVTGAQYLGSLVLNDDTGPDDYGVVVPRVPAAPPEASAVVIDNEVFFASGYSSLDVEWTGATGATNYRLYVRNITHNDPFSFLGETTGTSLTVSTRALFGETIQIAVQAIGARGASVDVDSLTSGAKQTYIIRRDDRESVIAEFPDDVTNVAIGSITDTDAALTWTAPAVYDGFEVRLGIWHQGAEIIDTALTVCDIKLNALVLGFGVRAYIEVPTPSGGVVRYYSPTFERAVSSVAVPSGYDSATTDTSQRFNGPGVEIQNGVLVEYLTGSFGLGIKQIDRTVPLVYKSEIADGGVSDDFFISTDIKISPYPAADPTNIPMSASHLAWTGEINRDYVTWAAILEYGDTLDSNGEIDNAASVDITGSLQTDLIFYGRYFRLVVRAMQVAELDEDLGAIPVFIERAALAINPPL